MGRHDPVDPRNPFNLNALDDSARQPRPGVTLGYVAAGILAGGLWLGVGFILLPVMLLLVPVHSAAARQGVAPAADCPAGTGPDDQTDNIGPIVSIGNAHHRWLARHHLWSVLALVFVVFGPLLGVPALISDATTVANTLAHAPHPLTTLWAAWPQLHVATLLGASLLALLGWIVASFWITLRVIRRWLRWAEGVLP